MLKGFGSLKLEVSPAGVMLCCSGPPAQELRMNPGTLIKGGGLGFRVWGLGFRVSGFGFRVSDFGFRGGRGGRAECCSDFAQLWGKDTISEATLHSIQKDDLGSG